MAKLKTKWICQNCGYETAKYLGKCPDCGQWNTFVEEVVETNSNNQSKVVLNDTKPCLIDEIEVDKSIRFTTGIEEFDRVLGGGLVQGSIVLLAGDPGIGKSTILLQTGKSICKDGRKALYVSAEESASQVKLRAQRLGVKSNSLYIYSQTNFEPLIDKMLQIAIEKALYNTSDKKVIFNLTSGMLIKNKIRKILIANEFKQEENQSSYEKEMFGETFCIDIDNSSVWMKKIKQMPILINK